MNLEYFKNKNYDEKYNRYFTNRIINANRINWNDIGVVKMVLEDYLDMTLRDILDEYCAIYNLECGYYYGISKFDTIEELFNEYDVENEYPEAFEVDNIVNHEVLDSMCEELLSYDRLVKIMKNLGISKKTEKEVETAK